jgi:hypothetical protein
MQKLSIRQECPEIQALKVEAGLSSFQLSPFILLMGEGLINVVMDITKSQHTACIWLV